MQPSGVIILLLLLATVVWLRHVPSERSPKRLLRPAFRTLTLVSLLLCVATIALWVRSYRSRDHLERFVDHDHLGWDTSDYFYSSEGLLLWVHRPHPDVGVLHAEPAAWERWAEQGPEPERNDPTGIQVRSSQSRLGIATDLDFWSIVGWPTKGFSLTLPLRWLAFASAISPVVSLILLIREKQRPIASNGYDLRATPDRCPECGQAAKAQAN